MRLSAVDVFKLVVFGAWATSIVYDSAIGAENTPNAKQTAQALDVCADANNSDKLVKCLSGLRRQTAKMAEEQLDYFKPFGPAFKQAPFTAGIGHEKLESACKPVLSPFKAASNSPAAVTLEVTYKVNECLNVISDTSHIESIKVPFDKARYGIIAIASNCTRGIFDADARKWCETARALKP